MHESDRPRPGSGLYKKNSHGHMSSWMFLFLLIISILTLRRIYHKRKLNKYYREIKNIVLLSIFYVVSFLDAQ